MKKRIKKQLLFGLAALIAIAVIVLGIIAITKGGSIKPAAAKTLIEDYINNNLMAPGAKATVDSMEKCSSLKQ